MLETLSMFCVKEKKTSCVSVSIEFNLREFFLLEHIIQAENRVLE